MKKCVICGNEIKDIRRNRKTCSRKCSKENIYNLQTKFYNSEKGKKGRKRRNRMYSRAIALLKERHREEFDEILRDEENENK